MTTITGSTPVVQPPEWAVLQRHLMATIEAAWREFEAKYTGLDGRLRYHGQMFGRDGVDDFYEPFFNWPTFYLLGGSDDILTAAKRHWEGVTRQLTERGFLIDEYERGYDWFHQGESLVFFYALCAADPADPVFRERALRFARLYLPGSPTGNYDPGHRIIVAPHNGSGGPRPGVGEEWESYPATQLGMKPYGLPLDDVPGIRVWDDLAVPANADRMGQAMQERMGVGDTAVNLAATSLAANAWLYDNATEFRDWIIEYVDAWRARAEANDGLIPDNVGPAGKVGELHSGDWYGGHYGWAWPHGLHSVGSAALIAATNDFLVRGDESIWNLARVPLDTVLAQARRRRFDPKSSTLGHWWETHLGEDIQYEIELVPYRHSTGGWFDWHPVPIHFLFWLWWNSGSDGDRSRLEQALARAGYRWRRVQQFRDKEEAGHEAAWFAWLRGEYPDQPRQSLLMALGQVSQRLALIRQDDTLSQGDDIHWWQQVNPVATEILSQQILGAPTTLYNGGLPVARLRYWDHERERPGLPEGVAALVRDLSDEAITFTLVNLDPVRTRRVVVQAGGWGEDRIDQVTFDTLGDGWPGPVHGRSDITEPAVERQQVPVGANQLVIKLPPLTQITPTFRLTRRAYPARHQTYSTISEGLR
ncbi:hypothetical protein GCM10029976_033230 [Kribbella albertanoniae]|uniref:Uncharacterized protein n=1 Tax=Kribbella albertanoniae TaxID=1266829 RepID=A0A4R4QI80_9ACTN|nr:hypothetical protein [Kribbella albertanoniae]TDC35466.1 hypothetical protein E1261_00965 [Kribbella albertanoniae]